MKKATAYIAILAVTLIAVTSCELETSGNGKLDGFWHLEQIDTIATGGITDLSESNVFWAFQHKLLELSGNTTCLCRFSHADKSLVINNPYRFDRENGDEPLTDTELLTPYGINALEEHFTIETLTSSKMVLSTDRLRLSFTKF